MIGYDAKYAIIFPPTLSHPPSVPDSPQEHTSILLKQDRSSYLPIHLASKDNAPGVQAMLQREFEAFCEYVSTQSTRRSSQNHQRRSHLLFARSQSRQLPIDILVDATSWFVRPETSWTIVQTRLKFEAKWLDLTPMETCSLKRRSELLSRGSFRGYCIVESTAISSQSDLTGCWICMRCIRASNYLAGSDPQHNGDCH